MRQLLLSGSSSLRLHTGMNEYLPETDSPCKFCRASQAETSIEQALNFTRRAGITVPALNVCSVHIEPRGQRRK